MNQFTIMHRNGAALAGSRALIIVMAARLAAHHSTRTNRGVREHTRVSTAAVGFMIRSRCVLLAVDKR